MTANNDGQKRTEFLFSQSISRPMDRLVRPSGGVVLPVRHDGCSVSSGEETEG